MAEMNRDVFSDQIPPSSLSVALHKYNELLQEVKNIDLQLSDKNLFNRVTGRRLDGVSYHTWRREVLGTKRTREEEMAFLKSWIGEHKAGDSYRQSVSYRHLDVTNPRSLITAAHWLLNSLQKRGVKFKKKEVAVITSLAAYIETENEGAE